MLGLVDILDSLGTLQNINGMRFLFKTKCLDLMDRTHSHQTRKSWKWSAMGQPEP